MKKQHTKWNNESETCTQEFNQSD